MKGIRSIKISPLSLELDTDNPRFLLSESHSQESIRDYLLSNESILDLVIALNENGGLLPGERIVVYKHRNNYRVVEGNRRTCSLQLLLSRSLIPKQYVSKIPATSADLISSSSQIEVDVVPDVSSATALMAKRHIEGVRQWKPLAKKRFFAGSYDNGKSIEELSNITDISKSAISSDIKEYKLFYFALSEYEREYNVKIDVTAVKLDRFSRLFNSKVTYNGKKTPTRDILELYYDGNLNPASKLPEEQFKKIISLAFKASIVDNVVNTRGSLLDVAEIRSILDSLNNNNNNDIGGPAPESTAEKDKDEKPSSDVDGHTDTKSESSDRTHSSETEASDPDIPENSGSSEVTKTAIESQKEAQSGGGPSAVIFFEGLNWEALSKKIENHHGLLAVLNELYTVSTKTSGRKKLYEEIPVATGMILRSVYEQCLVARLKKAKLWSEYTKTITKRYPELKSIEEYVAHNLEIVFPIAKIRDAFNYIRGFEKRNFLNENIHNPGNIRVTKETLEGMASGGLRYLVQELINEGLI